MLVQGFGLRLDLLMPGRSIEMTQLYDTDLISTPGLRKRPGGCMMADRTGLQAGGMRRRTLSFATRMYVALLFVTVAPVIAILAYEHRHPCLKYSTRRVLVGEYTIYVNIDTERGLAVPITSLATTKTRPFARHANNPERIPL
jgi:hypothetical protein